MNLLRLFISFLLIAFSCVTKAQQLSVEISNILSESDIAKINKVDSYISQGNEILFANFSFPKDSLSQKRPNYIELSKNLYAGKRVSRLLFEAKDYYKTGFKGKLAIFSFYINEYLNRENGLLFEEVVRLNDSIKACISGAEKFRGKSKVTANLKKGGEHIHTSNLEYQKAILLCEKALVLTGRDKVAHQTNANQKAQLVKIQKEKPVVIQDLPKKSELLKRSEPIVENKVVPIAEVEKKVIKVAIKKQPFDDTELAKTVRNELENIEVYYTVQILADKESVPDVGIKQIYDGKYPIVKNRGDGWYRYSFGKFKTLSDAKKTLTQSKVKGYIVAYKNEKRISLTQAKAWFVAQNN